MTITLVIASLPCGGAERVLCEMANYWAERGHKVRVLTFDDGTVGPFYELHASVEHQPLNLLSRSSNIYEAATTAVKRIRKLRRAINNMRPDIVISFLTNENIYTLIAMWGTRYPVIVSERVDIRFHKEGLLWKILRRLVYPMADRVVVQTAALSMLLRQWLPRVDVVTIPNPVAKLSSHETNDISVTGPYVIAVGRLHNEHKGFDKLLQAFSIIHEHHPRWKLVIVGDGPDRSELEGLRNRLNLNNKVIMLGEITCIEGLLEDASLFVMSSLYEGFPNALCEAMAHGLPVISYDCPSGPGEIVRDGVDGILVPVGDVDALARALDRLIDNEPERKRLASNATRIVDRFSAGEIMSRWEELLASVGELDACG